MKKFNNQYFIIKNIKIQLRDNIGKFMSYDLDFQKNHKKSHHECTNYVSLIKTAGSTI